MNARNLGQRINSGMEMGQNIDLSRQQNAPSKDTSFHYSTIPLPEPPEVNQ